MKKILAFCLPALLLASSCVSDLEDDYNTDPKSPTEVPAVTLLSNAQYVLTNTITTPNYNLNPFRYYVQHWAATQYPDESQYDITTRQINRFFWDPLYRDVLGDLREARRTLEADLLMNADLKASQMAVLEVLEVYAWTILVNTYGDIPYTEAMDINNVQPKYDDDAAIYTDLFTRLNSAVDLLVQHQAQAGPGTGDLFYQGDLESWIRFANSLKLRMGITVADANPTQAKAMVESAVNHPQGVFTSSDQDARLVYTPNIPTANQVYFELRRRNDNIAANTLVDRMKALSDPRIDEFFRPATAGANVGQIVGGVYGASNVYRNFGQPSDLLRDPTLPGVLLSYTEVEFLLAEAKIRGFDVGAETAISHYNKAITNSIVSDWGGTPAEAVAYLARAGVAFNPANWQESLGTQKWIALYNQPVEGWKEWRRLDYPQLTKPPLARTDIPLRFTYPIQEANLNNANYTAASTAMGGDEVTSRIFWDID
ncbi:MAG: SusD/RagB family nutrient-binding outer membrane lipoprotein [Adhaeribacter sp.]